MVPTAGIRSTSGSPLLKDFVPAADSLLVQRMKAAGCIVIGKTNTPEFGLGSHTFNEVFGATRNAFDPTRSAGGSSGGAAVAIATRMLPVADGSDSMGSLRNPAAWNNVFGFRPSQGRVPNWPAQDVWVSHFGTEGPMARNVRDLALMLDVQAGYDARVPLSLATEASFAARLEPSVDERTPAMRIGWLGDLDGHLADGRRHPRRLPRRPRPPRGRGLQRRADCARLCPRAAVERLARVALVDPLRPDLAAPGGARRTAPGSSPRRSGSTTTGAQLSAAQMMQASVDRSAFYQQMVALFDRFDFLALPTAQVWPFPVEWRWPKEIAGRTMDTYHRWMEVVSIATFAGLPCVSVPVGFNAAGLPMGLQLIGRPRGDMKLLRLARDYERVAGDVLAVRPAE